MADIPDNLDQRRTVHIAGHLTVCTINHEGVEIELDGVPLDHWIADNLPRESQQSPFGDTTIDDYGYVEIQVARST